MWVITVLENYLGILVDESIKPERDWWYESLFRQLFKVDFLANLPSYFSLQYSKTSDNTQLSHFSLSILGQHKRRKGIRELHFFWLPFLYKSSSNFLVSWGFILPWNKKQSCGFSWRISGGKSGFLQGLKGNHSSSLTFQIISSLAVNLHGFATLSKKIG